VVGAGCSGSDDGDGNGDRREGDGATEGPGDTTVRHTARLSGDPFTLGVASGDPLPDSVILWTRLAPQPLVPVTGGMPDDRVDVVWQVATDEAFRRIAAQGVATAQPADAHAVHVDPGGLDPATDYHYRFTVGEWTSPVGRTRTAPESGAELDRLTLAIANCQMFDTGAYSAYRHLLDEELDMVVHLGDYIYELDFGVPERPVAPAGIPVTLDDYRLRYASYRVDPDLQAAHARYPFLCMWDDHEVANNYAADTLPAPEVTAEAVRAQRAAAYRAYWEHLPVRLAAPDGPDVTLYRDATFGGLARLYLLDERQYADEPPCRDTSNLDFGNCDDRTTGDRQYLGADQEAWLSDRLDEGGVTWNLIGNPMVVAGIDAGDATGEKYYLETWDGYPPARRRFLERLAADDVTNPVVLTGDYHAGMVNDVRLDPEADDAPVVATELMSPPLTSVLFDADIRARNPHVQHFLGRHGYLKVTVEPDQLTADFRVLDDVTDPASGIATESSWRIDAGSPSATRV
jgi:alkaline phosphatase D